MDHLQEVKRAARDIKTRAADLECEIRAARRQGISWQRIADAINGPPDLPGGRSSTSVRDFYGWRV